MIRINDFDGFPMAGRVSMWVPECDGVELAAAADLAARRRCDVLSCAPGAVATLWPWLEKTDIKIMPRFYVDAVDDVHMSDVTRRIKMALRAGAAGAQIFVAVSKLTAFANALAPLRDELFLGRDLAIGADLGDVDPDAWKNVFGVLDALGASAFVAAASRDAGNRSDLVGRIYAMLDAWAVKNTYLHFAPLSGVYRAEQAWRLVEKMRPELVADMRFFAAPQS